MEKYENTYRREVERIMHDQTLRERYFYLVGRLEIAQNEMQDEHAALVSEFVEVSGKLLQI